MPAFSQPTASARVPLSGLTVLDVMMAKTAAERSSTDFGSYLKALAADNGYNQATLARAAGVNQTQLSRAMENQTIPTVDTLRKLAGPLNVRLADLMIRARLATAEELGTVGAQPPPLPPIVRDILLRLAGPKLTDRQKRALTNHLAYALQMFDEMVEEIANAPREPRMRNR